MDHAREALHLLREQYPQVFTVGSFIYGLPGDTPAAMRRIHRLSHKLGLDQAFFIPLTPLPGTPFWRPEMWDETGARFRRFNFLPVPSASLDHAPLESALLKSFALHWSPVRLRSNLRCFRSRDARRRRLSLRLFARTTWFAARSIAGGLFGGQKGSGMWFPKWYEN